MRLHRLQFGTRSLHFADVRLEAVADAAKFDHDWNQTCKQMHLFPGLEVTKSVTGQRDALEARLLVEARPEHVFATRVLRLQIEQTQ